MTEPEKKEKPEKEKPEKKKTPKMTVTVAVALMVIGVPLLLIFNKMKKDASSTTPTEKTETSQKTQPVTEENKLNLREIWGDRIGTSFYAGRSILDLQVNGKIQDDSLKINHVYWLPFQLPEEDAVKLEEKTNLKLNPGNYSAFFVETALPPDNPAIDYSLGAAFTPDGYPVGPAEPGSLENIMQMSHAIAFFEGPLPPDYPWQEVGPMDVSNNFAPLDGMGIGYVNPGNNIWVLIVPQGFVGLPGEPTNLTFQMFGRDMANMENFGVSGFTCPIDDIPEPVGPGIFVDGFESGDTSAWSNSFCNQ